MRYRNIITGAEFESRSKISAPDWITVGEDINPQDYCQAEDPSHKSDPQEPEKKTETKRPAAKKKGAKK